MVRNTRARTFFTRNENVGPRQSAQLGSDNGNRDSGRPFGLAGSVEPDPDGDTGGKAVQPAGGERDANVRERDKVLVRYGEHADEQAPA